MFRQISDAFLHGEIKKDVERTYQELSFFQDQAILKLLSSVLFVWSKFNPEISYKQGMNELLASIVWVYFQEAAPTDTVPSNEYSNQHSAHKKSFYCLTRSPGPRPIFLLFSRKSWKSRSTCTSRTWTMTSRVKSTLTLKTTRRSSNASSKSKTRG